MTLPLTSTGRAAIPREAHTAVIVAVWPRVGPRLHVTPGAIQVEVGAQEVVGGGPVADHVAVHRERARNGRQALVVHDLVRLDAAPADAHKDAGVCK